MTQSAESVVSMGVLDLDRLLREISSEAPSGDDLEYDPVFGQMERAAQGRPEQEIGETFVEAADADWGELKNRAIDVLERSHDLRAALYLARAALHTDGFPGFRDGLAVLREYVELRWDSVHPQLDPDDDNDPTMRVNTLVALCDHDAALQPVREAPMVTSRLLGRFSYRDLQIAEGEAPPREGQSPPEMATILAAFSDCDLDELKANSEAVAGSAEAVDAIEASVTNHVGAGQAADLSALSHLLRQIGRILDEHLQRRGVSSDANTDGGDPPSSTNGAAPAGPPVSAGGEIQSREDVIRTIDRVCEYYQRQEPSSPIPLLLNRAKRLVHKDFLEILEDLAPNGLLEVHEKWGGSSNGAATDSAPVPAASASESADSGSWG